MPIVQIIIDDSTSKIITGSYEFDRAGGGTLVIPSGSSFPETPAAKELFWRTDEGRLYRRSDANDAWVAVVSAVAAHHASHESGGSDVVAHQNLSGAGTNTHAQLDTHVASISNPHATTAFQVGAPPTSRAVNTSNGLQGGGDLSADRVISPVYGSAVNTVCQGNDSRLSDARTPTAHASTHKGDGADAIAIATTSVAGLESAADKTKLDGIAAGATNTPLSSTPPIDVTKTAASAGTAAEAARQDHKHDIATAAPGTTTFGSASEGTATSLARSDHAHTLTAPSAPADVTKAAASAGSSANVARQDHKHDVSTAAAGAAMPGDSAAEGAATSLARSDHRHSLPAFGSGAGTFCQGNDSRLSDARIPTAHKTSHEPGGSDAMAVDAAAGTGSLRTLGTSATAACAGNDSRLSDSRTPTAHAASHKSGGSDAIKLDELAAPTDVTTLDASVSAHGLLPKLGGGTSNYLRADGTWATPSGSGGVFGSNPQQAASDGISTTTSSTFQDKTTLTTGALTGTYRVAFSCEIMIGAANARYQCRLYNSTDATELCFDEQRPSAVSMYTTVSGFVYVTFAGAAKTFKIQFASQNNITTVTIRRARIEFWRVS
jgi:hypothetical protein